MRLPLLTFVYDRKKKSDAKKVGMIELRISRGKERLYIATGVKVLPHEWKDGMVVGRRDWRELNKNLDLIKSQCYDIIALMVQDGGLDINAIPQRLKDKMMCHGTFLDYAKSVYKQRAKAIRSGTQKHYKHFFEFMDEWKGIVAFSDLTEKNVRRLDDYLSSKGIMRSTRWNYHKMLKSFILQAWRDGMLKHNPYDTVGIKRVETDGLSRYLTMEEFRRFETCEIDKVYLERVRDLFVFQTYTLLSYSDLAEFDFSKCVQMGEEMMYKGKRVKTGREFVFVLCPAALEILKRYDYKLPIITNEKYNYFLKQAIKYAKIDKPVTSHYARHTGATMLLNEGNLPMHVVQHILGHASIRETEKTYAKVLDETIVKEMTNYHKSPAAITGGREEGESSPCRIIQLSVRCI